MRPLNSVLAVLAQFLGARSYEEQEDNVAVSHPLARSRAILWQSPGSKKVFSQQSLFPAPHWVRASLPLCLYSPMPKGVFSSLCQSIMKVHSTSKGILGGVPRWALGGWGPTFYSQAGVSGCRGWQRDPGLCQAEGESWKQKDWSKLLFPPWLSQGKWKQQPEARFPI